MSNKELQLNQICKSLGAKRCFGRLKNNDAKPAQRLSEKTGIGQDVACELIRSLPVLMKNSQGFPLARMSMVMSA
jgi:hypothetical protein